MCSVNNTLIKCAHCGHTCNRTDSMMPPDDIDPADVKITLGERYISLFCTNPKCNKYTIECFSSKQYDYLLKKYEAK